MMSARITPIIVKSARISAALRQPVNSVGLLNLSLSLVKDQHNHFAASGVSLNPVLASSNFLACRSYSSEVPKLPSKNELEKMFFKVTVVVWDLLWKITIWIWAMFKKHLILNPTVQEYWKRFNQKLEDARKN